MHIQTREEGGMAARKEKEAVVEVVSVCEGCKKIEQFSFKGCANTCQKFIAHIKEVFAKGRSPCLDFRCGVPGVWFKSRVVCENCPLPKLFTDSLGEGHSTCVLGKDRCYSVSVPLWLADGCFHKGKN